MKHWLTLLLFFVPLLRKVLSLLHIVRNPLSYSIDKTRKSKKKFRKTTIIKQKRIWKPLLWQSIRNLKRRVVV